MNTWYKAEPNQSGHENRKRNSHTQREHGLDEWPQASESAVAAQMFHIIRFSKMEIWQIQSDIGDRMPAF
jgi:hypothetical protein